MPTFREDLHTGHKVPLVESDDIVNGSITYEKLADGAVDTNNIKGRAVTEPKLADNSVNTRTIQNGAITPEKLSDRIVPDVINPLLEDLQNQISSIEVGGKPMSNCLGNSEADKMIGVSKWYLTDLFNRIWAKFSEITGEVTQGIAVTVSPEYYIGENGADVKITINPVGMSGMFESVDIGIISNGVRTKIYGGENIDTEVVINTTINGDVIVDCYAQILGIIYHEMKNIKNYSSFWLGAGSGTQSDIEDNIMTNANLIPVKRGAYDRSISAGQHIIVVLGESLAPWFVRADMNGMEIAMSQSTVTKDGVNYVVFTSQDTYQAGTYNIDING